MAKNQRLIDLSGQTFGRWIAIHQDGNNSRGGALWHCRCKCGTVRTVLGQDLRSGKSTSCGCAKAETAGLLRRTHGASGSRLYNIWKGMRARCNNPNNPRYDNYGGRGITICDDWNRFQLFAAWAASVGYRDGLSIERMDVNGNYEPDNCMWAGAAVQSANRRFVKKAPDGELWWHKARRNGITRPAYQWRLDQGWPLKLAVTWPLGKRRKPRRRNAAGQFI